jgi:hypothetical protein
MRRPRLNTRLTLILLALACGPRLAVAQSASPIAGVWTLNRSLSEFPKEIGFNIDLSGVTPEAGTTGPAGGGGRGRRGSGGGGGRTTAGNPFGGRRESYEDAQRLRLLTSEARNPPSRLMVVDSGTAVTITNELGQSRTLHPTGKEESIEIEGAMVPVTTKRDGEKLIATFHVEQDREITYTYSVADTPKRLAVEVQFLERGMGDKATRVYEPGAGPPASSSTSGAAPSSAAGSAFNQPAHEAFDQRPGAEFIGLKSLGILVEDLGPEAAACGLRREAIEDALTKRLTAGGLSVRRNSDDDTYVYVNIITTNIPNAGACVTRYDAFLYTHATAKLSYRDQPVLVQVSLLHRGGIGTSAAISHPAAVTRGLESYMDLFVQQIRDANK